MQWKQQECKALLAGLDKLESRMESVENAIQVLDRDSKHLVSELGMSD